MADPLFAKVSHAFSGFDECYAFDVSTEEAPIDFLNSKKDALSGLLSSKIDEFKNIKVIACLRIQFVKPLTGVTTQPYMNSSTHVLFNEDEIEQTIHDIIIELNERIANYQREGSGWVFDKIIDFHVSVHKHTPLHGSSYMDIPRDVGNTKAVINVKNKDNMCFKWSVLAALHPVKKNSERVSKYREYERELNFDGISFPVSLKDITKFETQNGVSVNVFGYDPEVWIYPLRITKMTADRHVDLLLVTSEDNYHNCLVKDFDNLMHRHTKNQHRKFFCKYCLHAFSRENLLQEHTSQCMALNGAQKTSLPEEGENILEFTNYHKGLKVPFVIYADFESITQPIDRAQMDETRSYTDHYQLHAPCGYAYKVVCIDDEYTKDTVVYRGQDCVENFLKALKQEKWRIWNILNEPKPLIMTDENERDFEAATICHICREHLEDDRVRDHCHVSGKYRGAAHNACNLKFRIPSFIPVVMHNLKGYDSNLIMQHLGKLDAEITCIPSNMEKYMSFTIADRYRQKPTDDDVEDEAIDEPPAKRAKVSRSLNLRFIDSLAFMNASLDSLVKNLKSSGAENFIHLNREFDSPAARELLTKKGFLPLRLHEFLRTFRGDAIATAGSVLQSIEGTGARR